MDHLKTGVVGLKSDSIGGVCPRGNHHHVVCAFCKVKKFVLGCILVGPIDLFSFERPETIPFL